MLEYARMMSVIGARQMGHFSPCAFNSSPQCMHTHMCPQRYTTEVILASEQMTQFPDSTTPVLDTTVERKLTF